MRQVIKKGIVVRGTTDSSRRLIKEEIIRLRQLSIVIFVSLFVMLLLGIVTLHTMVNSVKTDITITSDSLESTASFVEEAYLNSNRNSSELAYIKEDISEAIGINQLLIADIKRLEDEISALVSELESITDDSTVAETRSVAVSRSSVSTGTDKDLIIAAAKQVGGERGVPWQILTAMAQKESTYRLSVVNSAGATGAWQVMPLHFDWIEEKYGITDARHHITSNAILAANIACDILLDYSDSADSWHMLLMCYNMGVSGAQKQFNSGNYSSSYSRYIMDVATELGYSGEYPF